jgi:DNA repair exonuclease SbcCD nuclease subunit
MKKADLLLCGDLHLREDTPICRTDNFLNTQWNKLRFIFNLQEEHNCPILCSGDLFDKAKPSLELMSEVSMRIPPNFHTVMGNHDLPNHSMLEKSKCGVFNLWANNKLDILNGTHFNQMPTEPSVIIKDKKILVWHVMTYKDELPFPGCTDIKARSILHKYPEYDLVLTGDNHQPFTQTYKGRLLVNPGSMMRQEADQMGYKPCVWLWYADTNTVDPVYLPIEQGVVTREHLDVVEAKSNRIQAFIETLNKEGLDFVNFEHNLKVFLSKNDIHKSVEEIIYEMLDE